MKLLITTRADETTNEWKKLTHPIFKKYAKKVGADFKILDEKYNCEEANIGIKHGLWHFRIMEHYNLHEVYDRILHIDTDAMIMPNCPNLFEVVPYEKIGTIYEDVGSRRGHRLNCLATAQKKFGVIGWQHGYINTGVFLTSKIHKNIFTKINNQFYTDWGTDDVHIGYNIKKYNYLVHELDYKFNHMTIFSENWAGNKDRFSSHIIHYAGNGVFDNKNNNKLDQCKSDFKEVYGCKK